MEKQRIKAYTIDENIIQRNKYPRMMIIVQDYDAELSQIASALRKAAEFLDKGRHEPPSSPS